MTAQHTPGPWQLDELGIIYSGDCTELCDRHSNEHVVAIVTDARPEDRRLIAAAPLMLEALMEAQLTIDWFRRMALDRQNPREFDPMAWTQAKQSNRQAVAAIRAATGEDA